MYCNYGPYDTTDRVASIIAGDGLKEIIFFFEKKNTLTYLIPITTYQVHCLSRQDIQ